ncbi:MAG: hypothetical protein JXA33_20750 [Anaerolineae bacterium]|nr:hypothetical protein [Anaerolineae bacterium]
MNTTAALLERWFWLAVSLVLALFTIIVRWILEQPESRFAEQLAAWRTRPEADWIIHTTRMVYALGIPTLALFWRGVLTERGLGLKPWPWTKDAASFLIQYGQNTARPSEIIWEMWVQDLGWCLLFATAFGFIIKMSDLTVLRMQKTASGRQPANSPSYTPATRESPHALREAIYHQVHWAFYREPFVLLWGVAQGAWLGLLPVAFEALINPPWWKKLRSPTHSRDTFIRIGLAVLSVLIYIQTQNLWLAILTDTILSFILG